MYLFILNVSIFLYCRKISLTPFASENNGVDIYLIRWLGSVGKVGKEIGGGSLPVQSCFKIPRILLSSSEIYSTEMLYFDSSYNAIHTSRATPAFIPHLAPFQLILQPCSSTAAFKELAIEHLEHALDFTLKSMIITVQYLIMRPCPDMLS